MDKVGKLEILKSYRTLTVFMLHWLFCRVFVKITNAIICRNYSGGGWRSKHWGVCSFSWFIFAHQGIFGCWVNCQVHEIPCWKSPNVQSIDKVCGAMMLVRSISSISIWYELSWSFGCLYLLDGSMTVHLSLSRPLSIWQQYTHHAAFASIWQPSSTRKKKTVPGSRNGRASVLEALIPCIIYT